MPFLCCSEEECSVSLLASGVFYFCQVFCCTCSSKPLLSAFVVYFCYLQPYMWIDHTHHHPHHSSPVFWMKTLLCFSTMHTSPLWETTWKTQWCAAFTILRKQSAYNTGVSMLPDSEFTKKSHLSSTGSFQPALPFDSLLWLFLHVFTDLKHFPSLNYYSCLFHHC